MPSKKSKQPSYLQRQRQLRAQQQQVRQASSNKLPPGKKGGDVTKPKPGKTTATSKPAPVQQVRVRDLGTTKPNQMGGSTPRALPPGRTGGALTRTSSGGGSAALRAATKSGRGLLGKAAVPLAMAGEVNAMMDRNRRWNDYKERTGLNRPTASQTGGTRRGGR